MNPIKDRARGEAARAASWTCRVVLAALALAAAPPVQAQRLELTPFVGYRVFGSLVDWQGREVESDDALSYGGYAGVTVARGTTVEVGFSRQDTEVTLGAPFNGRTSFDAKIDQWSLGAHQEIGRPGQAALPFAAGYVGMSRMTSSDGDGSVTKFMSGIGVGAKVGRPTAPMRLRLEARSFFTIAGSSGASIGCGPGGCGLGFSSQAFVQMDFLAALVIGFGRR